MAEPDRVMATIQQLAHEEHELRAREGRGEITTTRAIVCDPYN